MSNSYNLSSKQSQHPLPRPHHQNERIGKFDTPLLLPKLSHSNPILTHSFSNAEPADTGTTETRTQEKIRGPKARVHHKLVAL